MSRLQRSSSLPPSPRNARAAPDTPRTRLRNALRIARKTHTLIVYVRPVDALVGAAPHMLLVPDEQLDAELRDVLETAHRASSATALGDDDGTRERYRARAIALCDADARVDDSGMPRLPGERVRIARHPGALARYRVPAPETSVACARISHVYFVYGNVGA